MNPSTAPVRPPVERGDHWRFGRVDVVFLKLVVVTTAIGYPATTLLPRVLDRLAGRPLSWETLGPQAGPEVTGGSGGATGHYTDMVRWTVSDPTALQWWGSLLPGLGTAALLVVGCGVLWRLLTLTRSGDPFSEPGVRLVRALSLIVLAYAVLLPFLRLLADALVMTPVQDNLDVRFRVGVGDFAPFVIGLVMLVAAECFRQGLRLRDDVAGLV